MKNQKTTNKERVKTSGIRFRYLMDAQRRSRSSKRKQKDLIKQLAEAGQEVAAGIEDLLKEMFNGE